MSNFCVNYLTIIGTDSTELERFHNVITNNNDSVNKSFLLTTKTTDEFIFDVAVNYGNKYDLLTKHNTNIQLFAELSEMFPTLTIKLIYAIYNNDYYGRAIFRNGTVKHKQLTESDFSLITNTQYGDEFDIEFYIYKDIESDSKEEVVEYMFDDLYSAEDEEFRF
jgi:hypothetical protein